MPSFVRRLLAVLFIAGLCFSGAGAQEQQEPKKPAAPVSERIAGTSKILDGITKELEDRKLQDNTLQDIRKRLEPLSEANKANIEELLPRLEEAKSRVDKLGTPPKKGDPAEAPEIAADRAKQQKAFDEVNALVKRARLNELRLQQLADNITNRRRDLLQRELLKNSRSIVNPWLWIETAEQIPANLRGGNAVLIAWSAQIEAALTGRKLGTFIAGSLLLLLAFFLLRWGARRILRRESDIKEPGDVQKAIAALWVTIVIATVPVVIAFGFLLLFEALVVPGVSLQRFAGALVEAVQRTALAYGLARGLLAPTRPDWRLLKMSDYAAQQLTALVLFAAILLSILKVLEVWNDIIAAPLTTSIAIRGFFTILVALATAATLLRIAPSSDKLTEEFGPVVEARYEWLGIARLMIWLVAIVTVIADLAGYINLANFLIQQTIWIIFVLAALYLFLVLASQGLERLFSPDSRFGHAIVTTVGVQRSSLNQVGILLGGLFSIILFAVAAILILAPFGIESDSMIGTLSTAFFGFTIGGVRISVSTIVIAVGLFFVGYIATRTIQKWLDNRYLPSTQLDSGLRNSIRTSAGYLGVILAVVLSLSYVGFGFEKLALVAGALSVGIGFGLQSIVSNFVSGLILLWERSVKVGDWVIIGPDEGYVRHINIRATEIETFDRQTVIIPNSSLITGVVKNWVHRDTTGRIIVDVGVSYDSDPEQVRDLLLNCVGASELIMRDPAPYVIFTGFGDSSLNFELRCYISNIDNALTVRSKLRFEIFRCFREAGIEIPFPQRDLNLRDFDKISELVREYRQHRGDSEKDRSGEDDSGGPGKA